MGRDAISIKPAALELVWAADELEVFSGPTRVDDETVVIQVTDGDRLFLVGVDVSSGEERWRQETSPGEVVTGISLSPSVIGDHPVYFRRSRKARASGAPAPSRPSTTASRTTSRTDP